MPLVLTIGLNSADSAQPDSWEPAGEFPPVPPATAPTERPGAAATTGKDGRIYILGGGTGAAMTSVVAYDPNPGPAEPVWDTNIPPMTVARSGLSAVTGLDGKIYAIGGTSNVTTLLPIMEFFDPAAPERGWTRVTDTTVARYEAAAAVGRDGRIYVMGGGGYGPGANAGKALEIYDPAHPEKGWVLGAPMTEARRAFGAALGGDGRIYAVGGGYPGKASAEAYDPVSDIWSPIAGMKTARQAVAVAAGADGRIYAFGGTPATFQASLSTMEIYDPNRPGSWEPGKPMSKTRESAAAAGTPDGRIFVFGGRSVQAGSTTGPYHVDGQAYTPPSRGPAEQIKPPRVSGPFSQYGASANPRSLTADGHGNIWFTAGESVGRLSPNGALRYFPIPPLSDPARAATIATSSPHGITVGPDGNIWIAEQAANAIGRMTPSGAFSRFLLPDPPTASAKDAQGFGLGANRIGPRNIVTGPDGALWFTILTNGRIGRITTDGVIAEYPIPTPDSRPDDITLGPDGNLWFLETMDGFDYMDVRPREPKIGRITPSGFVTEYAPKLYGAVASAVLRSITSGPDGKMWFTQGDFVGRFDPKAPDPAATIHMFGFEPRYAPNGISAGPDGNIYFAVNRPYYKSPYNHEYTEEKKIFRIAPSKPNLVAEFDLPKFKEADGTVSWSGPGDVIQSGNRLWFTLADPAGIGSFDPALAGGSGSSPYLPHGAEANCVNLVQRLPLRSRQTDSDSCDMANDNGPLDHVIVSATLNCQVWHIYDDMPEHYQQPVPTARDGECGTFIAVPKEDKPDEMKVWGPRTVPCYYHNAGPWPSQPGCGGGAKPAIPFRMQDQRGVFGSGTANDPYRIETDVAAGEVLVSQTDKYVVGSESYRTDVKVTNPTDKPMRVRVIRAGDCWLQDSDRGTQRYNPKTGGAACRSGLGPRIEEWTPISPDSNWFAGDRQAMWRMVGDGKAFPNACLGSNNASINCKTSSQENAAGLTWDVELAPGESATRSHMTTFAPFGYEYPKAISSAEVEEPPSGESRTVELTVTQNQPAEEDQTVYFRTLDGSAAAFEDYEITEGELVIPEGQTSATIEVPVLGDTEAEQDEAFSVEISTRPLVEPGGIHEPPTMTTDPVTAYETYYGYATDPVSAPTIQKAQTNFGTVTIKDSGERREEGSPGSFNPGPPGAGAPAPGAAFRFTPGWDANFVPPETAADAPVAVPIPASVSPLLNPLQQPQAQSQQQGQQQSQRQQQQQNQQQQQAQQQSQTQTMAALMNEQERQRELAKADSGENGTMFASARETSRPVQVVVRAAGALMFVLSLGLMRQVGRKSQEVRSGPAPQLLRRPRSPRITR